MHTLLIHQVFVSPNEVGGTRHYELARHAIEQGDRFTIVASNLSYLTGQRISGQKRLLTAQWVDDLRILRAFTFPSLHRSFAWRVISFLSFMLTSIWAGLRAGPVDVVMGTSPPIFQAVSAWLIAVLRRRPFLLEIRDLWPTFAIDLGVLRNPLLIAASRWLEGFLYKRATHLLVNSPAYRDYLIEKGVSPQKISLIANGVTPEMFDPAARGEAVRHQWGINGHFVVTYAGALGLANDIPTILRAADRLRDQPHILFLLVGDGKERTKLEEMAQQLKLPNVIFTGAVPKTQMSDVLAASSACVATLQDIPMFRTTYPNKVFDYMAAGRPVILAIDGVIRQVVDAGQAGLYVPPGDDKALAAAVLTMVTDPVTSQSMGDAGRRYVEIHFNRRDQGNKFVQLLHSLSSS